MGTLEAQIKENMDSLSTTNTEILRMFFTITKTFDITFVCLKHADFSFLVLSLLFSWYIYIFTHPHCEPEWETEPTDK